MPAAEALALFGGSVRAHTMGNLSLGLAEEGRYLDETAGGGAPKLTDGALQLRIVGRDTPRVPPSPRCKATHNPRPGNSSMGNSVKDCPRNSCRRVENGRLELADVRRASGCVPGMCCTYLQDNSAFDCDVVPCDEIISAGRLTNVQLQS